jgi:hypothetical protein
MARKSLRPHLNQIREWVRQGRTDAWIAHQLEITTAQLRDFRRQHDLVHEGEEGDVGPGELDLRDEIEAEIEAAAEDEEEADEVPAEESLEGGASEAKEGESGDRPRRRRRRRGRRGRGRRSGRPLEATFDHGENDGYGLWLDPAVRDDPVYAEHWAGHRPVTVTIEADRIVIQRAQDGK